MEILFCRPEEDTLDLIKLFDSKDFRTIGLPTIKIVYKNISEEINRYSSFIFTSKYSVKGLFNIYSPEIFVNKIIYAVGFSTANLLKKFGLNAKYPHPKYNSQELLQLISKNSISQNNFAVVSGVGGNTFLLKELSKYTKCMKFDVYERIFEEVQNLSSMYIKYFSHNSPDIIVVTSLDIFKSLIRIFTKKLFPKDAIITITSQKMLEFVNDYGFENTLKLDNISNDYIFRKISEIKDFDMNFDN